MDGARRIDLVPVAPGEGDNPYASQSVWEFAAYVETPAKDSAKVGSYALSARALRFA